MVKFDSKEVRDTVDKELAKQEGRFEQLIHQYVERLVIYRTLVIISKDYPLYGLSA